MLVVTRTKGDSIKIGDNIEVIVVETRGDKVRLGIVAPKEVPVLRHDAKQTEKHGSGLA